jgi:poly(A) polymerase
MRLLGIKAGPVVGQARNYLLELRMSEGPLDPEDARKRLLEWAREQGITGS